MLNNTRMLLLMVLVTAPLGCSRMTMHEDYGKAVSKNTLLQTENVSASQESHPDVKMDGQKSADVVKNYRSERPTVITTDLSQ